MAGRGGGGGGGGGYNCQFARTNTHTRKIWEIEGPIPPPLSPSQICITYSGGPKKDGGGRKRGGKINTFPEERKKRENRGIAPIFCYLFESNFGPRGRGGG